ncbi:MAG: hypothetical protein N2Z74_09340, partial [Syntrophales bacterium]|nr:hypothetical protein [Syntrophales bacterium]
MLSSWWKKAVLAVLCIAITAVSPGAAPVGAFSVDLTNLYYYDYSGTPVGSPRTVNYNFSAGTINNNVITIPNSFITKPPPDAGLTYT